MKLSPKEKKKRDREQRENQARNDERRKTLRDNNLPDKSGNLLKLRLWEELNPEDKLDRKCPFTGRQIGLTDVLSDRVEIEHLIPFSKSWDDSPANKTLCYREANRAKGQKTPFEAFGHSPSGYDWEGIAARAANLPDNKVWRFGPDAMDRFNTIGGFLERQLRETSWLARSVRAYMTAVCHPYRVWVIPGRLTALLRGKWGLNRLLSDANIGDAKNRLDHRHHAIDALVTALTDRALLQHMARLYDEERERVVVEEPWQGFHGDVAAAVEKILVSHKPEHGTQGKLHEETAYGLIAGAEEGGNLVYRKPLMSLTEKEIPRIRDAQLRGLLAAHVARALAQGQKLPQALSAFVAEQTEEEGPFANLRRVRLVKAEKADYLVPVRDAAGAAYKAYAAGENLYIEIFETPKGKWLGEAVTLFQANQPNQRTHWAKEHPGARLVMRVHKGDAIRLMQEGQEKLYLVHRLDAAAGRFKMAELHEAGNLDRRHDNPEDPFRWLMIGYNSLRKLGAERVRVDEMGRPWRVLDKAK